MVQFRVYAESGERLSGSLTESNVAEALRVGEAENVLYRVGDVAPCKVIDAEVPEFGRVRVVVDRLFGVFVAPIVAQPDVEAKFGQNERKRAFRVGEADPDFGVHEKTMVKVYDRLICGYTGKRRGLAFASRETMETETVAVLSEDNMILMVVPKDPAQLLKVLSLPYPICNAAFC